MYEFATGVINVWEKRLLSRIDQERMLKSPDRASAFMALFDTDLGEIISSDSKKDIEEIFTQDLISLKKKLDGITDDNGFLVSFLFLKFDALNLKSAFKSHLFPEQAKSFEPFDFSLEPYKNLESCLDLFFNQKARNGFDDKKCANNYVAKMLSDSVETILNLEKGKIDSRQIEQTVDAAYFKLKAGMAKEITYLEEFVRLEIDIANLRSLLAQESSPYFLEGGNLNKAELNNLIQYSKGESEKGIKKFLETLQLSFLMESFKEENSLMLVEKKLEGYIAESIFRTEKEKGSGVEKVMAFFQKKINSHANIRLILFAKDNGLSISEIEKALLPI